MIESSVLKQYGIRLRYELSEMPAAEFLMLIQGLMDDTPLGRTVEIRAETDRDRIKAFNKDQRRIYDEWHRKETEFILKQPYSKKQEEANSKMFLAMFQSLAK